VRVIKPASPFLNHCGAVMITLPKLASFPRWLVVVSLGLNLVLIVVVGGHVLFHPGPPPNPVQLVARMADALPAADAEKLRLALKSEGLTPDRRGFEPEAILDQARVALRAEPFDPASFDAIFRKGLADRDATEQAVLRAVTAAAAIMSEEGRHRLADLHCLHHMPPPPTSKS